MTRTLAELPVGIGIVPTRTRDPLCATCTGCAAAETAPRSAAQPTRSEITRRKSAEGTVGSPGMAGAFEGKRALILGVANKRSIAWAIAQVLADGGAKLAFTYQGEIGRASCRERV